MIRIIMGDITEITDVDVIVNSAKKSLMGGGGVDGAIHWKAGGELLKECKKFNGCNTGEAKITKGYNLKVPYVIHAVGPIYHNEEWANEHNYNQEKLLKQAYINTLTLAKEYNLKRIAFSAIATGAYSYPIDKATKIALDTIIDFLNSNLDFEITLVLYTEEHYNEYLKQIKNYNIDYSSEKRNIDYEPMASIDDSRMLYKNIFVDNSSLDNDNSYSNIEKESLLKKIINKILK